MTDPLPWQILFLK